MMATDWLGRGDCLELLPTLPADSVQLVCSSPPYNVGWGYARGAESDRRPLTDYLGGLLEPVLAECQRVLRVGGVLALNVPPTIRSTEYRAWPLGAWVQMHLLERGWLLREVLAWVKAFDDSSAYSGTTAIGGPRNPYLRPCYELLLLASKGDYRMAHKDSKRWPGTEADFGRYLHWAKDVWHLPPGKGAPGQPLAFPDDLAVRLVYLYSEPGDVVLDPFAGTGTVLRVARKLGRVAWGVELEPTYWPRLEAVLGQGMLPLETA